MTQPMAYRPHLQAGGKLGPLRMKRLNPHIND